MTLIRISPADNLPLWRWAADRDRRRYPRHVRALADRFGLPLATAATVAELAGIGGGR